MCTQKNHLIEMVLLSTQTYAKHYGKVNIYNFTLTIFVYLNRCCFIFQLGDNLLTTAGATDIIKSVLDIENTGLELIDLGVSL